MNLKSDGQPLTQHLEDNFEFLTAAKKRLARYILSYTNEAAFLTADEFAAKTGTAASTVVRFAKELGYSGYPTLQKDLQRVLVNKINAIGPLQRAEQFQPPKEETAIYLSLIKDRELLDKLIETISEESVKQFIEVIFSSRNKYVIGNRSSFSLAHFFYFQARKFFEDIYFLTNDDSSMFDILAKIGSDDLIIAFSFPRYATQTILFAEQAVAKTAKVISITDRKISPIHKLSSVSLLCPIDAATFYNSNIAAMALSNAIIAEMFSKNKDLATENLKKEERVLKEMGIVNSMAYF